MSKEELNKPLSFWLNKMKVFWALHGGIENWNENGGVNVCSYCPRQSLKRCKAIGVLKVKTDLSAMYIENETSNDFHHNNMWCAEWIKYV